MNLLRALLLAGIVAAGLSSAPALADGPHGRGAPRIRTRALTSDLTVSKSARSRIRARALDAASAARAASDAVHGPDADYLGPEINGETYRMKFIQNGRVIWVDIDPQTGRIIRRSRP